MEVTNSWVPDTRMWVALATVSQAATKAMIFALHCALQAVPVPQEKLRLDDQTDLGTGRGHRAEATGHVNGHRCDRGFES